MFKSLMFHNCLKLTDVTPLHKKDKKELKATLSKVFERIMFVQTSAIDADFGKAIELNIPI